MKDSSRLQRRKRPTRGAGRIDTRTRRLRIEAMEGRVLLSGNTLDLSTFGNDLAPASYQTSSTSVSGQIGSVTDAQFNLPTPSGDSLGSGTIAPFVGRIDGAVQSVSTVVLTTFDGQQFSFLVSANVPLSESRYMLSADGHLATRTTGLIPFYALNPGLDLDYMRYDTVAPTGIDGAQAQLDNLDTIGATDLSAQSTPNGHKTSVAGIIGSNSANLRFVLPGEGGLTLTAPIGVHGANVGATSDLLNASGVGAVGGWSFDTTGNAYNDALGSVAGVPRLSGSAGGPNVSYDLSWIGDGIHVPIHPDLTQAVDDTGQLFGESRSAWQAIRINAEPSPNVVLEASKGAVDAEGGLIQLASLARISTVQLGDNSQTIATSADGFEHELHSSNEADSLERASYQLEGEWDRAIAMETVGAAGMSQSPDRQHSGRTSSGEASRADVSGPLSIDDSQAYEESGSDLAENATADAAPGVRITLAAATMEHDGSAAELTPVIYVGSGRVGNISALLTSAPQLDGMPRVGRSTNADGGRDVDLVRDEAFSDWHHGGVADATAASTPGQHRTWLKPAPFLAVLALERLVAQESRGDRRKRDAIGMSSDGSSRE
jgi:hypothetical protein